MPPHVEFPRDHDAHAREYREWKSFQMLKSCLADKTFHHATYRDIGKIWEGLYIYEKASHEEGGFRGFRLLCGITKHSPYLKEAQELVKNTGWSLGSYGNG